MLQYISPLLTARYMYNVPICVPFSNTVSYTQTLTCVRPAHHRVTSAYVYEFVHVATHYTVYSWQSIDAPSVRSVLAVGILHKEHQMHMYS